VYLAEGLGHAFLSLADGTSVTYLVSTSYDPAREFTVSPLDAELDLPWPADVELELSARDRLAPSLAEAREQGLLPTMEQCAARYAQLRG
jgi:dTDP-4-dehydrorhamnose 3,5-epimerase